MESLTERWKEEQLSDNTGNFVQCKTCKFRDKVYITWDELDKEEFGWDKVYCRIYGRNLVVRSDLLIPYYPRVTENKPFGVLDGSCNCEHYQEEKRSKHESYNDVNQLIECYKKEYANIYDSQELNENGVPITKDSIKEAIVYEKVHDALPNTEA